LVGDLEARQIARLTPFAQELNEFRRRTHEGRAAQRTWAAAATAFNFEVQAVTLTGEKQSTGPAMLER
jgi:hypothetical protein